MLVYRIERPNGTGPYQFPGLLDTTTENLDRHPIPSEDGMQHDLITQYHFFGFQCLVSLQAWFDKDMREFLFDKGCVVRVYDAPVDRVLRGLHQVAFVRDASKLIKTLDLLTFLEIND